MFEVNNKSRMLSCSLSIVYDLCFRFNLFMRPLLVFRQAWTLELEKCHFFGDRTWYERLLLIVSVNVSFFPTRVKTPNFWKAKSFHAILIDTQDRCPNSIHSLMFSSPRLQKPAKIKMTLNKLTNTQCVKSSAACLFRSNTHFYIVIHIFMTPLHFPTHFWKT